MVTGAEDALSSVLPPVDDGNYYRITLTGHSEPMDLSALTATYTHLTIKDQTQPPIDIWKDLGSDSFSGEYFTLLKDAIDSAAPEDSRILQLAATLSRQILDGEEVMLP